MIVVKDVDVIEHDNSYYELVIRQHTSVAPIVNSAYCPRLDREKVERIYGQKYDYISPDGRKSLVIGWSKKVHDKIGIPLEAMQDANNRVDKYHAELCQSRSRVGKQEKEIARIGRQNIELNQRIEKLKKQSFWQRVKYLFSGKWSDGKKYNDQEEKK